MLIMIVLPKAHANFNCVVVLKADANFNCVAVKGEKAPVPKKVLLKQNTNIEKHPEKS